MLLLKGTIENGQVVLPQPANLPDGTAVTVLPHEAGQSLGIPDEEWPTHPDDVASLLARMDRLEAFEMTPAEEADMLAWRQKVEAYTIAKQHQATRLFE